MSKFDRINVPHTPEWCKFNDNSKAKMFRSLMLEKYGGEFRHNGKWYQWIPPDHIEIQAPNKAIHPNQGQVHFTTKKETPEEVEIESNPHDPFKSRLSAPPAENSIKNNSPARQKGLYIITDPEGNETEIENFSKFCRDHGLNKSAMYEVARGKRRHHKQYICRKKEYKNASD